MCLVRPIDPPKRLPTKGYKWMIRRSAKTLESPIRGTKLRVGRWLIAKDARLWFSSTSEGYSSGFHCFASKREARRHWLAKEADGAVLVACEIDPDSITAWGVEAWPRTVRCFAARRIKLIGEVEA